MSRKRAKARPTQHGGIAAHKKSSVSARGKKAVMSRGRHSSAPDAVDQQLTRYRAKRDFTTTAEPEGKSQRHGEERLPFVVQKHDATRLHYDFRLGWRGVLKSWAVTKGPSYSPGDKRLAVQVEDHPLEYGTFEGTIPKGQYGGGTVMVWDAGTWEPRGDVDKGLAKGRLKFTLSGQKLKGNWVLIRMRDSGGKGKANWLLIKEHDQYERSTNRPTVIDQEPDSVVTGRSLDEIAAQKRPFARAQTTKSR